ncbi:hypothetical protein BDV96DRAFT_641979 [Lophiotrema nucula]|uniref:Tat pathway signal sequence n=1 Tax=Lophiotrema nucula TaxID=690887 RepID=A0A6A5ZLS8_9PLEO|nr:hypothetical protein BDV96DRAFT_641979 [Lophiotrema nucula]
MRSGYGAVQSDEDVVSISKDTDHSCPSIAANSKRNLELAAIFASGLLFGILLTVTIQYLSPPTTNWLLQQTNTWTPLLDRHTLTLHDIFVNGSIFNDPYSIYRDAPSPEVDAAWSAISTVRPFPITSSEVLHLGKDPTQAVRIPEPWGYGPDMHFAELDSQHLLHCLNTVRKYAHHNYYFAEYSNSTETLPRMLAVHRDHCIGMLLEALTCRPSMNVVTFEWMETQRFPFPDFGVRRKCVDYGGLLEWQKGAEVKGWEEKAEGLKRPEGARVMPALKGLLEVGEEMGRNVGR